MAIANRTKELVEQRGIKVKALAAEAGLSYSTVFNFIHGYAHRIDLRTLDRICRVLQVQPGDLFAHHEH